MTITGSQENFRPLTAIRRTFAWLLVHSLKTG
jgi:hypothetical protein